jgi:hypothetical protein
MTDQHTPGPWVIERRSRHGEKEISRIITPEKDGWGNPLAICSFVSQWGRKDKPANANLIAAAPDLLAALGISRTAPCQKRKPDMSITLALR